MSVFPPQYGRKPHRTFCTAFFILSLAVPDSMVMLAACTPCKSLPATSTSFDAAADVASVSPARTPAMVAANHKSVSSCLESKSPSASEPGEEGRESTSLPASESGLVASEARATAGPAGSSVDASRWSLGRSSRFAFGSGMEPLDGLDSARVGCLALSRWLVAVDGRGGPIGRRCVPTCGASALRGRADTCFAGDGFTTSLGAVWPPASSVVPGVAAGSTCVDCWPRSSAADALLSVAGGVGAGCVVAGGVVAELLGGRGAVGGRLLSEASTTRRDDLLRPNLRLRRLESGRLALSLLPCQQHACDGAVLANACSVR